MNSMALETMPVGELKPYPRNARTHSRKQIKQIARSIERFGFTNPVLISDENEIIAGHGRVQAAKLLSYSQVPICACRIWDRQNGEPTFWPTTSSPKMPVGIATSWPSNYKV